MILFPMSNLREIESAVLSLPPGERTLLVDWMDEHRNELLADGTSPESETVIAEVVRRREELKMKPHLSGTFDTEYFNRLRRKGLLQSRRTPP
jgi:hypothetical protein